MPLLFFTSFLVDKFTKYLFFLTPSKYFYIKMINTKIAYYLYLINDTSKKSLKITYNFSQFISISY